jgi:hypothetical protein
MANEVAFVARRFPDTYSACVARTPHFFPHLACWRDADQITIDTQRLN